MSINLVCLYIEFSNFLFFSEICYLSFRKICHIVIIITFQWLGKLWLIVIPVVHTSVTNFMFFEWQSYLLESCYISFFSLQNFYLIYLFIFVSKIKFWMQLKLFMNLSFLLISFLLFIKTINFLWTTTTFFNFLTKFKFLL